MATLTGLFISQSYGGVIHLSTNTGIVTGSSTQLQDGFGNNMGVLFNGAGNVSASSFTGLASNATSASYANTATSASYSLTATSASYSLVATSASYAANSTSASYALTASFALQAASSSYLSGSTAIVNSDITIVGGYAQPMTIGFGKAGAANTNIAIGNSTLMQTDGGKNVAIGFQALKNVCSGSSNNIAIGANALRDMGSNTPYTSGSVSGSNIAIGSDVAATLAGGNANVMIGDRIATAATLNGNFNGNTIIGKSAGESFNTGQFNTFVGFSTATGAGFNDANSNTIIGARITGLSGSLSNNIILSDGDGNIRARYSGSWVFSGTINTTASFATSASYALTSSFVGPTLNQNLVISGSTAGVVKVLTISSQTASMDLSTADLFTLTLVSGSTTFLNPTNIKVGQTGMLQITQAASGLGTLGFSTAVTFPSGYNYSATTVTSSVDLISFVSFNTSSLRGIPANQFI